MREDDAVRSESIQPIGVFFWVWVAMSYDSARIVWAQGLFLRPQHFQQQERFIEWSMTSMQRQLHAFPWGFSKLAVDEALLKSGKLALKAARGLLPDGTPFELPSQASPLKPLDVPPGTRDTVVHLHAIMNRPDAKAIGLDEGSALSRRTRFVAIDATMHDNVVGMDSDAEVKLGVLVLQLALESTLDGAMTSLPIARVLERKGNFVELDPAFVPPLLDAFAHSVICSWVVDLFGLVKQRANMLEARLRQAGSKGIADLLLLQLCNRYQPLLAQWCSGSPVHPYPLHQEMLKFAGECTTFDAKSRRPPAFPPYDHLALAASLAPLVYEIHRAMANVPDQTAVMIPLRDRGSGIFSAEIPDPRMIASGHFVLGVTAQWSERRLREEMPGQIRIGDPETMVGMNISATSSIRVELLPGAPVEIHYHANWIYFKLDPTSNDWRMITVKRQLALFVAGDPPGLELEFWAIRTG
jgi:type VI secretion system protein ImpJ